LVFAGFRMVTATNPDRWLTAKRLCAHGTILAVCLWAVYAWTLATPGLRDRNGKLKGTDFLHFYTLGWLARTHDGSNLYDVNAQAMLAAQHVPQAAGIRYLPLYPPQVSILFAPLADLSYPWALVLWWLCSSTLYGVCCYPVWRACPNLRDCGGTVILLAAAFPAFAHLIAWGQTSALALACFTGMFFLLRDGREFSAGLVLGCLIFKPQLGLAAVLVFVLIGAWRIILGAALSAAVQLAAGVLYYGPEPLRRWISLMRRVRTVMPLLEPKPYQTHCLRTFWSMLVPGDRIAFGLYILSAMVVLGLTAICWSRALPRRDAPEAGGSERGPWGGESAPFALRYSSLLVATVLVAPHLTVYDLVILAPAFLLLADWLIGQQAHPRSGVSSFGLGTLLYLSYMLPLLGPFARVMRVQFSVVAMAATVYVVWQICCQTGDSRPRVSSRLKESTT
jgi:alpha-1,2-mannosyltransferase